MRLKNIFRIKVTGNSVKKPAGARPGMVTYDNYRTLYVTPEEGLAKKLFLR